MERRVKRVLRAETVREICGGRGGRWVLKDEGWQGVVVSYRLQERCSGWILITTCHRKRHDRKQTPYWFKNKNSEGSTPEFCSRKTNERI
jgi:hypothetical protein